jgi:hypothetical protein
MTANVRDAANELASTDCYRWLTSHRTLPERYWLCEYRMDSPKRRADGETIAIMEEFK